METFNEIKKMIINLFAVDEEAVAVDAHLEDDLQGDSLAVMRLAEAIGTHYEIEITAEDLLDVDNVGELVDVVQSKISSKPGS
ncbi:MAG: acyl carrier protein [Desulfobacterales bacterium]|nr:MAG: acyl carrier protein [Desulfobacterales bacterium]